MLAAAIAACALLLSVNAWATASDITGPASVIDADTLEIHGQRIRLHGIDAPEAGQLCEADGKPYRCGQQAALALADLIGSRPVTCQQRDTDRYARIVAVCTVAETDLGRWMVQNGWAVAYYLYSYEYERAEFQAKTQRLGIWRGDFVLPWEWRRGQRLASETANDNAPGQCLIKGNISSAGERIYHVPGGAYYDKTKIDPSKGERWFCTETEARTAGWRKSKR